MEALLASLNLGSEENWEKLFSTKAQKRAATSQQADYIKYLQPQAEEDETEEGFIGIESTSRLKVLKTKTQKPSLLQNLQATYQTQVTQSTYNLPAKKKKLRSKYATKTNVQKPRFQSIGNVKGDWKEVRYFNLPNLTKATVEHSVEVLKTDFEALPTLGAKLFNIRPTHPIRLQSKEVAYSMPANLIHDAYLMQVHDELQLEADECAFFMPDYVFMTLATVAKKEFPRNISVAKTGNKFFLYAGVDSANPFVYLSTYKENSSREFPDNEKELGELAERQTCVEELLQKHATGRELASLDYKRTWQYLKITLDERLYVYTKVLVDAVDANGQRVLVRALYEDADGWGHFAKKYTAHLQTALLENSARVAEWYTYAQLTQSERVAIGCVSRNAGGEDGGFDLALRKVDKKTLNEIGMLFNLRESDCYVSTYTCLKLLEALEADGEYVINKVAFKPVLTLFKTA